MNITTDDCIYMIKKDIPYVTKINVTQYYPTGTICFFIYLPKRYAVLLKQKQNIKKILKKTFDKQKPIAIRYEFKILYC